MMTEMYLRTLSVVNFKNIREAVIDFSPKLNTFIGDNGAGKTNLLDALYSLSFSKSFFTTTDQLNIMHTEDFFMLQGRYSRNGEDETVVYGIQNGQKKQLKRNGKLYKRMSEHIGYLPLVMISPADSALILSGSEERRKFMDGVISQFSAEYLHDLLRYNRILLQRNNLLRQAVTSNWLDEDMLTIYDGEMTSSGERIYTRRMEFIKNIIPVFQRYYSFISGDSETVHLIYQSDLSSYSFSELLKKNAKNDLASQYTTTGIHKDDLQLHLENYPLKKLGSQGQQKSYLVALKMAQFEYISMKSGLKPILLLDDIFDKLDKNRVEKIVRMVSGEQFGQIFITDTNREHLDSILHTVSDDYRIFSVNKGKVVTIR
jgi:DNA replication and repair protein RecF